MPEDQDRIDALEAALRRVQHEQDELRRALARAELDQWRGRIEDLEVQIDLGSKEARDRLQPLLTQLQNRWLDARRQFDQATSAAGDAFDQLQSGLEQAMRDIRSAVSSAASTARGD